MGCFAWYASSPWTYVGIVIALVINRYCCMNFRDYYSGIPGMKRIRLIPGNLPSKSPPTSCRNLLRTLATLDSYFTASLRAHSSMSSTGPRRLSPIPALGSGSTGNDNPYLAASLARHLKITPSNTRTNTTSTATAIPSPVRSPVRLENEDLNDTPGESDPSINRMDLTTLPTGYLEVGFCDADMITQS